MKRDLIVMIVDMMKLVTIKKTNGSYEEFDYLNHLIYLMVEV